MSWPVVPKYNTELVGFVVGLPTEIRKCGLSRPSKRRNRLLCYIDDSLFYV